MNNGVAPSALPALQEDSTALPQPSSTRCLSDIRIAFSGYSEAESLSHAVANQETGKAHGNISDSGAESGKETRGLCLGELKALVSTHGARVESGLTRKTSLLVTWRGLTQKRLLADRYRIPVVTPEGLAALVKELSSPTTSASSPPRTWKPFRSPLAANTGATAVGTKENAAPPPVSFPPPPRLLHGYLFCATHMPSDESAALRSVLERHGATFTDTLTDSCDALFVNASYAATLRHVNHAYQNHARHNAAASAGVQEESAPTTLPQKGEERLASSFDKGRYTREAKDRETGNCPDEHGGTSHTGLGTHDSKLFEMLSPKLQAAWLLGIPVLTYTKFFTMAQLAAAESTAAEGVGFVPARGDFDVIVSTTQIEAAPAVVGRLLALRRRQVSFMDAGAEAGDGHSAERGRHSHRCSSSSSRRDDEEDDNESSTHSSSSSETTISIASSLYDPALDPYTGEVFHEEEADGFTQTLDPAPFPFQLPAPPPLQQQQQQQRECDQTALPKDGEALASYVADGQCASLSRSLAAAHECPRFDARDSSTTAAADDASTSANPRKPLAKPEALSAKDVVRKYYLSISNPSSSSSSVHQGNAAVRATHKLTPKPVSPSSTSTGGAVQDQRRRRTRNGQPNVTAPAASLIPFYAHHPPYVAISLVGCIGMEARDAARMALVCRFLVHPVPTSDTDVVVLGRLALRKRVFLPSAVVEGAPSGEHDSGEEGEGPDNTRAAQAEGIRRRSPVPPLRDAAATAQKQRADARRALRAARQRKQEEEGRRGRATPAVFYEVSHELASSLQELYGLPTHRLAPLAWLRACYRAVQEKATAEQQQGNKGESADAVRPPTQSQEEQHTVATFGFGETFNEARSQRGQPAHEGDANIQSPSGFRSQEAAATTATTAEVQVHHEAKDDDNSSGGGSQGRFAPDPPLAEAEVPNPQAWGFRILLARPVASPFASAKAGATSAAAPPARSGMRDAGEATTPPPRSVKRRRHDDDEAEPAAHRLRRGDEHTGALTVDRVTSTLVVPVLAAAPSDSLNGARLPHGTRSRAVDESPSSAEEAFARERRQAAELLDAFLRLLEPSPDPFPSTPPLDNARDCAVSRTPSDVFRSLVACFIDGSYARPLVAALRGVVKLGRGTHIKMTEAEWRSVLLPAHKKKNDSAATAASAGVTTRSGAPEPDARLLEAVKRTSLLGKRTRDVFGNVLSRAYAQTKRSGIGQRWPTPLPFSPLPENSGAAAPPPTGTPCVASLHGARSDNAEEAVVGKKGSHDDLPGARGAQASDANVALQKIDAAAAAVVRSGFVALHLIPHGHEKCSESSTLASASGDGARTERLPLRYLPAVTSDYLLASLATERLLDPTACFVFNTVIPTKDEVTSHALLEHCPRPTGSKGGRQTPPPRVSAWQRERRYEKGGSVGVCVSFVWQLPPTQQQQQQQCHEGEGRREGEEEEGARDDAVAPQGRTASLVRVLCAALSRVVALSLGGTVSAKFDPDSVTHVVVVNVAAIESSALRDSFVEPGERDTATSACGSVTAPVVVWPLVEARAAVASSRRNQTCIVSDRWLQDSLTWLRFVDETAQAAYQQAPQVEALVAAAEEEIKKSKAESREKLDQTSSSMATPPRASRPRTVIADGHEASLCTPLSGSDLFSHGKDDGTCLQGPQSLHEVFNFRTPGSTPQPTRLRPASDTQLQRQSCQPNEWTAATAEATSTEIGQLFYPSPVADPVTGSPLPSQPIFSQRVSCQEGRSKAKRHQRSLRQTSCGHTALVSPACPGSLCAGHDDSLTTSRRSVLSATGMDDLMEMQRSAMNTALSQPRRRHHSDDESVSRHESQCSRSPMNLPATATPAQRSQRRWKRKTGQQGNDDAKGDEEAMRLPQVVLSSADNSLSQPPDPQSQHSADGNSNRKRARRDELCTARADDTPASLPVVLARCSYEADTLPSLGAAAFAAQSDAMQSAQQRVPQCTAPSSPLCEARTTSQQASGEPPVEVAEGGGEGMAEATTTATAPTQEMGDACAVEATPRLAYVATSPPPQLQQNLMAVDADEEESETGRSGHNSADVGEKAKTAAAILAKVDGVATSETKRASRGLAVRNQLAVYLLGDLPGREAHLSQYEAAVKRLVPTLPSSIGEKATLPTVTTAAASRTNRGPPQVAGAMGASAVKDNGSNNVAAAPSGPFVFVNHIEEADCLVCHELSQRETVLAAVAAGLWVVRPGFLSTITEHLRKTRRCDEYLGPHAPALTRVLELYEWSPQALPSSRSPTPPPPHPPQQKQGQPAPPCSVTEFKRALAVQCVKRRRMREEALRRWCAAPNPASREQCLSDEKRGVGGVFAEQRFVLFFPAFDLGNEGRSTDEATAVTSISPITERASMKGSSCSSGGRDEDCGVAGDSLASSKTTALAASVKGGADEVVAKTPPFDQHMRKKKEAIRVILRAGGAHVAFLGPLQLHAETEHEHNAHMDERHPVMVSTSFLLEQLATRIVQAMLPPILDTKADGVNCGGEGVDWGPPLLCEEPLSILFDSRLLFSLRTREVNGHATSGEELASWLAGVLQGDGEGTSGRRTEQDGTASPTPNDFLECLRLARSYALDAFERHRERFRSAHPEALIAAPSSSSTRPLESNRPLSWHHPHSGLGLMPQPQVPSPAKLSLIEQQPHQRRHPQPRATADKGETTAASGTASSSRWATETLQRLLNENAEPQRTTGATPSGSTPCVYVVPRVILFKNMTCVALDIAGVRPTEDGSAWVLGSIQF